MSSFNNKITKKQKSMAQSKEKYKLTEMSLRRPDIELPKQRL